MNQRKRLERIYARIPKVEGCRVGCSDCCGPIPMIDREMKAIPHIDRPTQSAHPRNGDFMTPANGCGGCAYSTASGCAIYERRPFVCRLFAAVADEPNLRCKHGASARSPLSKAEALALGMEYLTIAEQDRA